MVQRHVKSAGSFLLLGLAIISPTSCGAFTCSPFTNNPLSPPKVGHSSTVVALAAASSSSSTTTDLVVISPPGGIGEITSIEAARLGGSVKWFVISAPGGASSSAMGNNVALTAETLAAIQKSGGSMELAGASADSLLVPPENDEASSSNGALAAMTSWCTSSTSSAASSIKAVICTYDGAIEEKKRVDRSKTAEQREVGPNNEVELIRSGIRVAARELSNSVKQSNKIAILAAGEEITSDTVEGEENDKKGGGLFAGLFGGKEMAVPESMNEAFGGSGGVTTVIRYGELFGAPESSPESSPFMGGPRRDPTVREMYTQRSVRIDPTVAGGDMGSKSNRLALGEAASRLGLGKVDGVDVGKMDVSLSSFAGTEAPTDEEWNAEFKRVSQMMSSGPAAASSARLFSAEFSSVPSTKRLAEWIATKWAPAILRSYDIAGTRVGARPVYALQTADNTVEIVWQQLVDFNSVTSGKMVIEVNENGMVASRGGGDASKGFGSVSRAPLPGEDILVRRLADAASQAVEKGLAMKPQVASKKVEEPKKPVTTVVSTPAAAVPAADIGAATSSSGPGPRSAGARRSSERTRGSRRRKQSGGES